MQFAVSTFCLLVVAAVFVHAEPTPEQLEKIAKAAEVCKPKSGATDEDIETLKKHEIPESKTGTCFVACMNKEFGIMSADNKMDLEKIKQIAAPLKERDAEKYEKGMKVLETCVGEVNGEADECVLAKKMMECCKKEAAATGIMEGTA